MGALSPSSGRPGVFCLATLTPRRLRASKRGEQGVPVIEPAVTKDKLLRLLDEGAESELVI
jgi:hypothetical protein